MHGARADYYHAIRQGLSTGEAMQLLSAAQMERMFPIPVQEKAA
jgi:hypothetical protein